MIFPYENYVSTVVFERGVVHAIDIARESVGNGNIAGEYFYLYSYLLQTLVITIAATEYNTIQLIPDPVMSRLLFMTPNFCLHGLLETKIELLSCLYNLYKMFNQSKYMKRSLSNFYVDVKAFNFETQVLSCYQENESKQTLDGLYLLIEKFLGWKN